MKRIVLVLLASAAFLLPAVPEDFGHVQQQSSHHNIDWD